LNKEKNLNTRLLRHAAVAAVIITVLLVPDGGNAGPHATAAQDTTEEALQRIEELAAEIARLEDEIEKLEAHQRELLLKLENPDWKKAKGKDRKK
jgi:hypothetical protein